LFFPERLTHEFLQEARKTMGSYMFANQYQNEIIPEDEQVFRPEWNKYYATVPAKVNTYAFIDPAISEEDHADYTALVVVQGDENHDWYVRVAQRYRINPTKIVDLVFKVHQEWKCSTIGIESVAYQKALLYMVHEESKRRGIIVPVVEVRPDTDKDKSTRIKGLVPRFEWSRIFLAKGMHDLELELAQFPRGSHDDLIDALAYIDKIAMYPTKERKVIRETPPNHPDYEREYIKRLTRPSRDRSGLSEE
jgi:predicted phage terminase large subunit-like protein